MLILYMRPSCGHCRDVEKVVRELKLGLEERDIAHEACAKELVKRGGKQQVPYLVDTKASVEMYESEDIIRYLCGLHSSSEVGREHHASA